MDTQEPSCWMRRFRIDCDEECKHSGTLLDCWCEYRKHRATPDRDNVFVELRDLSMYHENLADDLDNLETEARQIAKHIKTFSDRLKQVLWGGKR